MKKAILLFAAIAFVAASVIAQPVQLEKGKIMTGVTSTISMCQPWGSELFGLGFTKTKYKYGTSTYDDHTSVTFNILPKAGYFFMDNLAGGIAVVLTGSMEKDLDDGDKYRESLIAAGPFVRYYYPLDKFYPFAEAEMMLGSWAEGEPGDMHHKEKMFMFGIYVGAALPLGEKVTLDGMMGYSRTAWAWDAYEGEGTDKQISGGLGIRVGFTIYLR